MRGLAFVFALHFGDEHPTGDRWFAADKIKHFATAAFVQSVAFSGLRVVGASRGGALAGATVTTAAVSIGKEVYDRRRGGAFSTKDLAWDAAGLVAASALLDRTER